MSAERMLSIAYRFSGNLRNPVDCHVTLNAVLCSQGRQRILTSVRLQSPSPQPGGSSPAISNSFLVEPGFVANTANTWPEQFGSVVKLAIV